MTWLATLTTVRGGADMSVIDTSHHRLKLLLPRGLALKGRSEACHMPRVNGSSMLHLRLVLQ